MENWEIYAGVVVLFFGLMCVTESLSRIADDLHGIRETLWDIRKKLNS